MTTDCDRPFGDRGCLATLAGVLVGAAALLVVVPVLLVVAVDVAANASRAVEDREALRRGSLAEVRGTLVQESPESMRSLHLHEDWRIEGTGTDHFEVEWDRWAEPLEGEQVGALVRDGRVVAVHTREGLKTTLTTGTRGVFRAVSGALLLVIGAVLVAGWSLARMGARLGGPRVRDNGYFALVLGAYVVGHGLFLHTLVVLDLFLLALWPFAWWWERRRR